MSDAFAVPTALHQAAISLHAMAAEDAAWVLAALPPGQRDALVPLLEELAVLGIPRDAALVDAKPPLPGLSGTLHALDDAGIDHLARILAAEPPRLVHAFLRADMWTWGDRLRDLLRLPQDPGHRSSPAPALQAALNAACERALQAPVRHGPSHRTSRWARLRLLLRRRAWA